MLSFLLFVVLGRYCAASSSDIMRSGCELAVPKCEYLQSKDCIGAMLPYRRTAPGAFTGDIVRQQDIQASLRLWRALRTVPQCWEVVQPLLCSVYLPPCKVDGTSNTSLVQRPSREQCDIARTRCRIVDLYGGWPDFLKCDQNQFSNGCLVSMIDSIGVVSEDNVFHSPFGFICLYNFSIIYHALVNVYNQSAPGNQHFCELLPRANDVINIYIYDIKINRKCKI